MDVSVLTDCTMGLMDSINDTFEEGGELVAIAIVAVVSHEGVSHTRTFCSDKMHYMQVGLLQAGLKTVESGTKG